MKNIAASIQDRLKNRSRETGVPLNRLLEDFAIDCFTVPTVVSIRVSMFGVIDMLTHFTPIKICTNYINYKIFLAGAGFFRLSPHQFPAQALCIDDHMPEVRIIARRESSKEGTECRF